MKLFTISLVSILALSCASCSSKSDKEDDASTAATAVYFPDDYEHQFILESLNADSLLTLSDSGVAYKIINEGTGDKVTMDDEVVVNYTGTLTDGKEFASTKEGGPEQYPVNTLISGFTEGLLKLGKGGKIHLIIPAESAYKDKGYPSAGIDPGATLIYDVEVVDIK